MPLNRRGPRLAVALAGMVPVLVLLAVGGEHADSDALAHLIWARQILQRGAPHIAEEGVCSDPSLFFPNTVPKPLPLLVSIPAAAAGGAALLQGEYLVLAFLGLLAASSLALRESGGHRAALWAPIALGLNPAWVMLTLRCRPSVMLIALVLALPPPSRRSALEPLGALTRPEGIFIAGWRALGRGRMVGIIILLATLAVWPLLNLWAAGDPLWSVREVRLAVEQMSYPTPGPAGYPLLLARRLLLVVGPVLLLALLRHLRSWPLAAPLTAWAIVLWASLAGGSLVLPRYLDPLALMALPWAVVFLCRMTAGFGGRTAFAIMALAVGCSMMMWPAAISAWDRELDLQRSLDRLGSEGWRGRLAINELLVPRVAEAAGTTDLMRGFVALDRAAYENADLEAMGVGRVVVAPHPVYLPEHTSDYLLRRGIRPDTLEGGG